MGNVSGVVERVHSVQLKEHLGNDFECSVHEQVISVCKHVKRCGSAKDENPVFVV